MRRPDRKHHPYNKVEYYKEQFFLQYCITFSADLFLQEVLNKWWVLYDKTLPWEPNPHQITEKVVQNHVRMFQYLNWNSNCKILNKIWIYEICILPLHLGLGSNSKNQHIPRIKLIDLLCTMIYNENHHSKRTKHQQIVKRKK